MQSGKVIEEIMKADKITFKTISDKIGITVPGVSQAVKRPNGMRIDNFVEILDALGYEVIVKRGKTEYKVTK